jgi:hypothetical protein
MKFITKIGVTCATTIALIASTTGYASTVATETLTSELYDNYIGADGNEVSSVDAYGGSGYDVNWMQVERTLAGVLTVKVNSNFISNTSSGYRLGDLFIMDEANYTEAAACTGAGMSGKVGCNESSNSNVTSPVVQTTNEWEYAFDLGGGRDTNGLNKTGSGDLRDISGSGNVNYSDDVIDTSKTGGHRGWQIIMVENDPNAVEPTGGLSNSWETTTNNNLLTMTFDISNTSLMDAAQLALRWQMTCANDIIEVVTNFTTSGGGGGGGSTSVPEPSTFLLMLLAGFGLISYRQKKV